jgi:hypothetical protein
LSSKEVVGDSKLCNLSIKDEMRRKKKGNSTDQENYKTEYFKRSGKEGLCWAKTVNI